MELVELGVGTYEFTQFHEWHCKMVFCPFPLPYTSTPPAILDIRYLQTLILSILYLGGSSISLSGTLPDESAMTFGKTWMAVHNVVLLIELLIEQ